MKRGEEEEEEEGKIRGGGGREGYFFKYMGFLYYTHSLKVHKINWSLTYNPVKPR